MASYLPEQLFEVAVNAHKECYGLLDEMNEFLIKSGVTVAKTEELITYVDAILQVCLLNGAFADGKIETNELIFIKNIAKSTDALIAINSAIRERNPNWSYVEWEGLPLLDESKQRLIVSTSLNVIKPYADKFIELIAKIDELITSKDYLKELTKRFSTIFVALGGIDGDDISAEIVANEGTIAFACYKVLVVEKWESIISNKPRFI